MWPKRLRQHKFGCCDPLCVLSIMNLCRVAVFCDAALAEFPDVGPPEILVIANAVS